MFWIPHLRVIGFHMNVVTVLSSASLDHNYSGVATEKHYRYRRARFVLVSLPTMMLHPDAAAGVRQVMYDACLGSLQAGSLTYLGLLLLPSRPL